MVKTCEWCDREIIKKLPQDACTIQCGGMECGHREIYSLPKEDCRQIILEE